MTRRQYSNTATEATLTGGIAAVDTSFTLTSFSGYPSVPFTATIARGAADEEVVLVTAVSVSTVTVTRGYDGTTAKSHAAGSSFLHTAVAKDFDEANLHVNASTAVHGITGAVVGTSDAQTLSNKTLVSPALATPSWTGVADGASLTLSGSLTAASAATLLGATTVSSLTVSGVSTLAAATLSGALTVAGAITANGGITVPTGKKITLTDAPATGTDAANKTYADARETAAVASAKTYTDTRETAIKAYADAQDASFGRHRGAGTSYPASPVEGDTFRRTDLGFTARYNGTNWLPTETLIGVKTPTPATATLLTGAKQTFTTPSIVVPPGARLRGRARFGANATNTNPQTISLRAFTVTPGATIIAQEVGYARQSFIPGDFLGFTIEAEVLIDVGALSSIVVSFDAQNGVGNNGWSIDQPLFFYEIGIAAP